MNVSSPLPLLAPSRLFTTHGALLPALCEAVTAFTGETPDTTARALELLDQHYYQPFRGKYRFEIDREHPAPLSAQQRSALAGLGWYEELTPRSDTPGIAVVFGSYVPEMIESLQLARRYLPAPAAQTPRLVVPASMRLLEPGELWTIKRSIPTISLAERRPLTEIQASWLLLEQLPEELRAGATCIEVSARSTAAATTQDAAFALLPTGTALSAVSGRLCVLSTQPFARYRSCVLANSFAEAGLEAPQVDTAAGASEHRGGAAFHGNHLAKLTFEEWRRLREAPSPPASADQASR